MKGEVEKWYEPWNMEDSVKRMRSVFRFDNYTVTVQLNRDPPTRFEASVAVDSRIVIVRVG